MLKVRIAELKDIAPIVLLHEKYQHLYLTDDDEISLDYIAHQLNTNTVLVIDDGYGRAIGVAKFGEYQPKRHCEIHLIFDPAAYKKIARQKIIPDILGFAFKTLEIRKIKAKIMKSQKGTQKLLKKYHFRQCADKWQELEKDGHPMDQLEFELMKKYFKKIYRASKQCQD